MKTQLAFPIRHLLSGVLLAGSIILSFPATAMPRQTDISAQNSLSNQIKLTNAFEASQTCTRFDPIKRYGNEIRFQIRRNDAPVGSHIVQFNHGRNGIRVIAQSKIKISLLGFSAYSFSYRSESLWQNNQLVTMSVMVDDNGDGTRLVAKHQQGQLMVLGPDGDQALPPGIFPTDHWHCGILGSHSVLNTITGKTNTVSITASNSEMLRTSTGALRATRFTYDGELETNAWYDSDGRWVGLQFEARDGSTITYRCMNCATDTAQKDP